MGLKIREVTNSVISSKIPDFFWLLLSLSVAVQRQYGISTDTAYKTHHFANSRSCWKLQTNHRVVCVLRVLEGQLLHQMGFLVVVTGGSHDCLGKN